MESYIQISKINDFMYCPVSLYLHEAYGSSSEKIYHEKPQVVGRLNHTTIDADTYSTSKRFLVGIEVYSSVYNIMGKIDIYDAETKTLIERKTRIKYIYDGYRYQLYAQYFCLTEMGHLVKKLVLRSLEDNKTYDISIPKKKEKQEFEEILNRMKSFSAKDLLTHHCTRCEGHIYDTLGW